MENWDIEQRYVFHMVQKCSKDYVMLDKYRNGRMTEIKSKDADFLEMFFEHW